MVEDEDIMEDEDMAENENMMENEDVVDHWMVMRDERISERVRERDWKSGKEMCLGKGL